MRKQCKNRKTGEIIMYKIEFENYIILKKDKHDGLWYPMRSLTEDEFNKNWVDLNKERKEKIIKLNVKNLCTN